jgi:hypothetical protein
VLEAGGEFGDLGDQWGEDGDEGAHQLALDLGLGSAGEAGGCGVQPGQQFGWGAAAGITVLSEEGGEAFLAEPGGAFGGGLSRSAKMAPAPGQKPSKRLRKRLARATRSATKSSRVRTSARNALISSEQGVSGRKRWPSVRRISASM